MIFASSRTGSRRLNNCRHMPAQYVFFISIHMCSGDVCQQFTREMYDMYQGFASYENWDFEVLNYTNAEYGGLHHAAVRIAGENVYRHLKHEGGTHRVRRIPEVGLSSRMQRIHTGTMTVIILPQPVEMGMRSPSDGIRTYNFSQDRITDHRTGYVARDIKEFMRGGEALDDLICDVRHDVAVYPYAISSKLHLREQHPDRADLQACMPVFKSFAVSCDLSTAVEYSFLCRYNCIVFIKKGFPVDKPVFDFNTTLEDLKSFNG
ncbi:Peptide chain release factor 1, mitochondrial [Collichthys lucidus]|uniref:Peptide chain release factor 1, mitochondrial n=1 Tax=Collichthys lucidus TaxID=240159 RepID=A0A4U5TVB4_COLLU|nr:Peptide chain release factor 1, mitochondrial [Collichthys lucidus]